MMLRAPKFTPPLLEGLRTLLRFDFVRSLRASVAKAREVNAEGQIEDPAVSVLRFLDLTNKYNDAEQPLLITATLMGIHGASEALIPLTDDRFANYQRIIEMKVGSEDFPSIDPEQLKRILEPLEMLQVLLRQTFTDAAVIERSAAERQFKAVPSGASGGMLN